MSGLQELFKFLIVVKRISNNDMEIQYIMGSKRKNKREKMGKSAFNTKQQIYKPGDLLIEEHIINFDVINSTAEQVRELLAWLQLELKAMRNIKK